MAHPRDRWRPVRRLGVGGFGEVWLVRDDETGDEAALKRVRAHTVDDRRRVAREVANLRQAALPGVVRLLGDWPDREEWCLLLEYAPGRPFPGPGEPAAWPALRGPALHLLRVLARLHGEGLVHRDLKPDNVVVGPEGAVTLLDFGLARLEAGGQTLTRAGQRVGTPGYEAPERLDGARPHPREDLFAVGVMLFAALTGALPWEPVVASRVSRPPAPSLGEARPGLPEAVVEAVDALLQRDPERRPADAGRVADRLEGRRPDALPIPLLAQSALLDEVVEAAVGGGCVAVTGAPGHGCRRFLNEAAVRLEARGARVLRVAPAPGPLGGLLAALGVEPADDAPLAEVLTAASAALKAATTDGARAVWLDGDLDRWGRRLLRGAPGVGVVPPGAPATAALPRVEQAELEALFVGPERVFHVPSAAAALLRRRTGGAAARVSAELRAWRDEELVRVAPGGLAMRPEALDRALAAGRRPLAPLPPRALPARLDPETRALLGWLDRAGAPLPVAALASLTGLPAFAVEAAMGEASEEGCVAEGPDGWRALWGFGLAWSPSLGDRRTAHAALADVLEPGHPERLRHLLAADAAGEAVAEALARAERIGVEGRIAEALAVLLVAAPLVVADPEVERGRALVEQATALALGAGRPGPLRRVAPLARDAGHADLAALLEAWVALWAGQVRQAHADAVHLPAFSSPELEDWRLGLRVQAAARLDPEALEAALAWASSARQAPEGPDTPGRWAGFEGQRRYQQGDFAAAAVAHSRAREGRTRRDARATAAANAASAWMEAGALDRARQCAAEALVEARACRIPSWEGRAEWLSRCVAYRSGQAEGPDRALLLAVEALSAPRLSGLLHLNEAAAAWRAGDPAARALAERAAQRLAEAQARHGERLARALALRLGARAADVERDVLVGEARAGRLPGIDVQVLGLLAEEPDAARLQEAARALVAGWSGAERARRREVLSADEATGAGALPPAPPVPGGAASTAWCPDWNVAESEARRD